MKNKMAVLLMIFLLLLTASSCSGTKYKPFGQTAEALTEKINENLKESGSADRLAEYEVLSEDGEKGYVFVIGDNMRLTISDNNGKDELALSMQTDGEADYDESNAFYLIACALTETVDNTADIETISDMINLARPNSKYMKTVMGDYSYGAESDDLEMNFYIRKM